MSDLSSLSGEERKLDFGAVRSVDDPACVKTALDDMILLLIWLEDSMTRFVRWRWTASQSDVVSRAAG